MELIVLGSGTAAPRLHRSESAYVIKAGKHQLLFDCGAGAQRRMLEAKIDYKKFNYMFFTHFHNDHINDLPAFIWSYNYASSIRKSKLNLIGPYGFKKYFKVLFRQILGYKKSPFEINIKEIEKNTIKIDDIVIRSASVIHSLSRHCIAYRIEYGGKTIVYSGDTAYTEEVISLSKNADLVILECSNLNENKYPGHLVPEECGKIAKKANAKALMLTHFYPNVDNKTAKVQAKKEFKGKIIMAKDLMRIRV